MKAELKKILIANRGEIAIRIAQSCADLGIESLAVYAEDDGRALHLSRTDSAVALKGRGVSAYLDMQQLIEIAKSQGCDAVHPGYGFLSENPEFSRLCHEQGLVFIGADAELLTQLGDKSQARILAKQHQLPLVAGVDSACSLTEVEAFYQSLGDNPAVMIKALAGGGGRGIRRVTNFNDLEASYLACQKEAALSFGDDRLYVEQLLCDARHVEVQILGDGSGAVSHAWERECSLQRRNQKLLEIAPSPSLDSNQRQALVDAACQFASAIKYRGLGTFEFLVDAHSPDRFYFMEVNPRVQVEHTITEEITGLDLIALQIQLAANNSLAELGITAAPPIQGVAMQARVNMESLDAEGNAAATAGVLRRYQLPAGPGVRVDHCGYTGYELSPSYDPLLAKVICKAGNYSACLKKLQRALVDFEIQGPASNKSMLLNILQAEAVQNNILNTEFVERNLRALSQVNPLANISTEADQSDQSESEEAAIPEHCEGLRAATAGVVSSIEIEPGQAVLKGQVVVFVEAMKMEFPIKAPCNGVLQSLHCQPGDIVQDKALLAIVLPGENADADLLEEQKLDLDLIRPDLAEVIERQAKLLDERRPEAVAKRHKKDLRTARENLNDLLDPDSFNEYGGMALAAQRKIRTVEELIEISPADGLVAGTGTINVEQFGAEASRCMALAYDYTVFAGTQGLMNHKKTDRVLGLAKQWKMPVVFYAEGGGGRPNDTDFAGVAGLDCHTFSAMAELSGLVPTVGVVAGRCFAGNAALLGVCDVVIATESACVGMAGPAMIEGGGLGKFRAEEVGPVSVQGPNGVVDILVADEAEATAAAKQYLSYFQGELNDWQENDARQLRHVIPENRMQIYDVYHLINTLADKDSVLELRAQFARGVVTALVRIEGRPMGLIANNPTHLGGAIDADAGDKMSRFMQLCDAHDLPIVSLCDTPGFMVGPESEAQATVRHISRIFVTASSLTVPYITLVTRKGYGLGAQAMAAGSFHNPLLTAAWPSGEFGAMGIEGAVRLGAAKKLAAIEDEEQRQQVFQAMVDHVYEQGKALNMASYLEIDAVIDPMESRQWLLRALASTPKPLPRQGKKRPCIDTW